MAVSDDKATRDNARAMVAEYHRREPRTLLEHLRDGFAELDVGAIGEFELDDLISSLQAGSR